MSPCLTGGFRLNNGYSVMSGGKQGLRISMHRKAAALAYGDAPNHEVHHICENRACFRPDHLVWLTKAEHMRHHRLTAPRKTHCLRGHERTPENQTPWGQCRLCCNVRAREYKRRKRAAALATGRE